VDTLQTGAHSDDDHDAMKFAATAAANGFQLSRVTVCGPPSLTDSLRGMSEIPRTIRKPTFVPCARAISKAAEAPAQAGVVADLALVARSGGEAVRVAGVDVTFGGGDDAVLIGVGDGQGRFVARFEPLLEVVERGPERREPLERVEEGLAGDPAWNKALAELPKIRRFNRRYGWCTRLRVLPSRSAFQEPG